MNDFLQWLQKTGLENIVWITDVDETLLEKSSNPNNVTHVPGLEALCETLDRTVGGGFYVITGRDFGWLDKVFPSKKVRASCEYHCLFRDEAGQEPEELNPVPLWELIDAEMEDLLEEHEGLLLRKKQFMRSLHYIAVPESERNTVKASIEPKLNALLQKHNDATGQSVGIVDGGKVYDMGPSDSDKGDALCDIIDHAEKRTGRKLVPVYFGDSPGDLPAALMAQQGFGGKFVSVGDDERVTQVADFHFKDPAEYRDAIQKLIDSAPKPQAPPPVFKGPGLP